MKTWLRRMCTVPVAVVALVCGLGSAPAYAHDSVIGATPAVNGQVTEFPRQIVLEFSGQPRESFNMYAVSNATTGEILFSGEPVLDGRNLLIDVPADIQPGIGTYTVGFQITSSDGHATKGKTQFEVVRSVDSAQTATPVPDSNSTNYGLWIGLGVGGVIVLLLSVLGIRAMARKID